MIKHAQKNLNCFVYKFFLMVYSWLKAKLFLFLNKYLHTLFSCTNPFACFSSLSLVLSWNEMSWFALFWGCWWLYIGTYDCCEICLILLMSLLVWWVALPLSSNRFSFSCIAALCGISVPNRSYKLEGSRTFVVSRTKQ